MIRITPRNRVSSKRGFQKLFRVDSTRTGRTDGSGATGVNGVNGVRDADKKRSGVNHAGGAVLSFSIPQKLPNFCFHRKEGEDLMM